MNDFDDVITLASEQYGVAPALLKGLIRQESNFNPEARNAKTGAFGIAQFMPGTAEEVGIDPADPIQSIFGAAFYLKKQIDKFGSIDKGLAAYNWGQGNLRKALDTHGEDWIDSAPDETKNYIASIADHVATYDSDFKRSIEPDPSAPLPPVSANSPFDHGAAAREAKLSAKPEAVNTVDMPGSVMHGMVTAPPNPSAGAPYDPEYLKTQSEKNFRKDATIGPSNFDFDIGKGNSLSRGVRSGELALAQSAGGILEFLAKSAGADETAKGIYDVNASIKKSATDIGQNPDRFMRNFEGAISSIVSQGPALLSGLATPALLYIGAQSFGQEFSDGTQAGLSYADSTARASAFAAAEVIGERIGMPTFGAQFKAFARNAPPVELGSLLAKHIAKEVPGEMLTTLLEFGIDKTPVGLNKEASAKELVDQLQDTVVQTVMQAGMVSGAGMVHQQIRANVSGEVGATAAAEAAKNEALQNWSTLKFKKAQATLEDKATVVQAADAVMAAPDVDTAAKTVAEILNRPSPTGNAPTYDPSVDTTAIIPEDPLDEQQRTINEVFGSSIGEDGIPTLKGIPLRAIPESAMPNAGTVEGDGTVTADGARALRSLLDPVGTKVIFLDDPDGKLPDGFVHELAPNTIFLSNNPQRAADFTVRHEFKHTLESNTLPDGRRYGDVLLDLAGVGITEEGVRQTRRFTSTAPAGASAEQLRAHYLNELLADTFADVSKTKTFVGRAFDYVKAKYGQNVAVDFLSKMVDSFDAAFTKVQALFNGGQLAESKKWFTNADEIHGVMVQMLGDKIGQTAVARSKATAAASTVVTGDAVSASPKAAVWNNERERELNETQAKITAMAKNLTDDNLAEYDRLANKAEDMLDAKAEATGKPRYSPKAIDDAAHQAATSPKNDLPEPTPAQKSAGNYRKGHVDFQGLDLSIENPVGSVRSGVSADGKPWSNTMRSHYGYIKSTVGKDKDHIDVFVGKNPNSDKVFVVDQVKANGHFDESKVMLGFNNIDAARIGYLENYSRGWKGMRAITPMTIEQLKSWAYDKSASVHPAEDFVNGSKERNGTSRSKPQPNVQAVVEYEGSMQQSEKPLLSQLRRSGNFRLQKVGEELSSVQGGRRGAAQSEPYTGSEEQRRKLQSGKYEVVDEKGTSQQYAEKSSADVQGTNANSDAVGRGTKNGQNNTTQSSGTGKNEYGEGIGEAGAEISSPSYSPKILKPEIAETLGPYVKGLKPEEAIKFRRDTAETFRNIITTLPSVDEIAAVAYAGRAKRGWYAHSAEAILHVFGTDAPRFAALLAAMSPQTSVEMNLFNAANTWRGWVKAGRPLGRDQIVKIMGQNVQGNNLTDSVLGSWINNSVRALTSPEPGRLVISGPKVNSFFSNLIGVTDEVTNDAWMANYALVDQRLFKGNLSKDQTDPGKTPGYLAMSAQVRLASRRLTKLTGETWTPAEVQETVWSWAKTLYEQANAKDSIDLAVDIVNNRELSDELIKSTPDFRTLFHDEPIDKALRAAGHGSQLDSLSNRRDISWSPDEGSSARSQAAPFAAETQLAHERRGAKRLDKLAAQRAAAKAETIAAKTEEDIQFSPKVNFEVAPDPDDKKATTRWNALSEQQKFAISDRVARRVIPTYLDTVGADGDLSPQIGSYLDETNPSFVLTVTKGDPIQIAKDLGYALSQNSMMVVSDKPMARGEAHGAVTIELGEKTPAEVAQIYNTLRKAGGEAISGQSYSDGEMTVLNFSSMPTEELADMIGKSLDGKYNVLSHDVYSTLIEKEDYGYDTQGNTGRDSPAVRLRENTVRQRVAQAIGDEFARSGAQLSPRDDGRSYGAGNTQFGGRLAGSDQASKPGAVSGIGVHYSKAERKALTASYFGTGYKGAELARVRESSDPRIQQRIYFYVNDGRGINPESGVGPYAHQAKLTNIYDATADQLDLAPGRTANEFESAVIDAGFDGYTVQGRGAAVLLGPRTVKVEPLGMGVKPEVAPFERGEKSPRGKLQQMIAENKLLPAGEVKGEAWKRMLPELDLSHLDDGKKYYKDELLKFSPKQTETPEFKRWFGDWQDPKAFTSRAKGPVSAAVNDDGTPMVLYHATHGDFSQFEVGRETKNSGTFGDWDTTRHAIFATPDGAMSQEFLRKQPGGNVMPVYMSIKSPMDLRNNKAWDYVDDLNKAGFEGTRWPNLPDTQMWEMFDDETGKSFVDAAKKAGFDGAIIYELDGNDKAQEVFVAFSPEQIKSAIGNNGDFDPANPDIRYSPKQPIFYSQMARVIDQLMGKAEPAKELAAKVEAWARGGKYKADELQWSGLKDWLALQDGKVSKAQVAEFLANDGVQVSETVLGKDPEAATRAFFMRGYEIEYDRSAEEYNFYNGEGDIVEYEDLPDDLKRVVDQAADRGESAPTKYHNWQLPGGENYRELLLTLPVKSVGEIPQGFKLIDVNAEDRADGFPVHADAPEAWRFIGPDESSRVYSSRAEALAALLKSANTQQAGAFHSSHFDQPNILAHVRLNERTDADGNRVLFIEELQSDWAQKIRKEGLSATISPEAAARIKEIEKEMAYLREYGADDKMRAKYFTPGAEVPSYAGRDRVVAYHPGDLWSVDVQEIGRDGRLGHMRNHSTNPAQEMLDALAAEMVRLERPKFNGAPAAPFVGNTSGWTTLAFKRMLRYAAENGFDKIAWTTGEQQAARYDLSKQVSEIRASRTGYLAEGKYSISIFDKSHDHISTEVWDAKELADNIGKDLADKIIADISPTGEGEKSYKGLDLKVGGEGMIGYYDKILPAEINKYVKRWGAKVDTVNLAIKVDKKMGEGDILPQFQDRFDAAMESGDMAEVWRINKESNALLKKGFNSPQPSLTITPEMRASVLEGQPLFSPKFNPNISFPEETQAEEAQRIIQDKFNRFKVLYNWAKDNGIKLSEAANVYMMEALSYGRRATRVEDFREQKFAPIINEIQKAGLSLNTVASYLHAMHAEERNDAIAKINPKMKDGSGMSTAAANAILTAYGTPQMKAAAAKLQAITRDTLDIKLAAGLISQETYDTLNAAYKNYVPLKGGDEVVATGTGKGFDINHKMRRALGHSFREEAIIENIMRDHETAIALAEKQRVALSLAQLALELGDPDVITVGQPEKRAVLKPGAALYEVRYDGGTVDVLHNLQDARASMQYHMKQMGDPKKWAVVKTQAGARVAYEASPMLQENEARFYINGEPVRMQINDPVLARAYKNMGVDHIVGVLRIGKEVNAWLSKAYTGYNPEFVVVNMARDFTEGVINLTGDYGAGTMAKVVASYPKALAHLARYAATGKITQDIADYRADGGSTGAAYLSDLERIGEDIKRSYNDYAGMIDTFGRDGSIAAGRVAGDKLIKKLAHFIEVANQASENAMRLATYNTLKAEGKSRNEAALAAKDVTLNFNRKGEVGAQMGALYLFFNPAMQGAARSLQTLFFSEHRAQAWALAGSIGVLGFAMAALSADLDPDKWDKTPNYVKAHNLVVPLPGGKQLTIPVPYGYGFFLSMGTVLNNIMRGKDKKDSLWLLANAFAESYSPIGNPVGDKPDATGLVQVLPTLARIPMEIVTNRSGLGSPIYPKDDDMRPGRPDSSTMFRNTKGTLWDSMARGANSLTGGNVAQKGWVDVHPDVLKSLWSTATGGTGRFMTDTLQLANLTARGATPDLREIPVLRKFVREENIGDARKEFWDAVEEVRRHSDEVATAKALRKQAGRSGNTDMVKETEALITQMQAEQGAMLGLGRMVTIYSKQVALKRERADAVLADTSLSLSERRAQVKVIEAEERQVYDRFMQLFRERKAAVPR